MGGTEEWVCELRVVDRIKIYMKFSTNKNTLKRF